MEKDLYLILGVLHFTNEQIKGRKRMQKIICILKHKYNIHFSYEFSPHLYGPYSEDLAHSLDTLITLGIVKEEREKLDKNMWQYVYELTPYGTNLIQSAINKKDDIIGEVTKISELVNILNNLSTLQLVGISKEAST